MSSSNNPETLAPASLNEPLPPVVDSEDEAPTKRSLMIFGRDCAKIPCFRDSLMCGIFTGTVTGIGYNLATSKNPIKLAMTTYLAVTFGVWIFCRRNFLIMEQESRLFRYVEKSRQKLDIPKDFNEENSSTMADSSQ
ncbi:cytochrome c oxidase assembly protein COX20, mitochondrial-like [Tigriopus californicus]|uniref:cytochrome c oxidase assembly protein COX20, mitochondrial-like n=1 Tax=Tigriopus californicus TaxID=6832 RepID=UPI0027DA6D4E|nr:cytochrome c oxidase assembly protein COX20, mitochondrial-like [Tigriopus californicus]